MKYDVFISYSSKDQKVVEAMCAYLEQHKIRCFVAYRDIPKGVVWAKAIVEALDESKMMVVVFSEEFNLSDQVDREIELASEDKKPILTFRISDAMFKGAKKYYLKNINWIDAFPHPEAMFDSLLDNVCKLIGRPSSDVNTKPVSNNPVPVPEAESAHVSAPKSVSVPSDTGKTWKVGDYYNVDGKEGVVFWVDETGKHGKIVSLDEKVLPWISERVRKNNSAGLIPCYPSDIINGKNNLLRGKPEDHPAMSWCICHGPDWYLPAEKELEEFLKNDTVYAKVSRTLKEINGLGLALMGSNVLYLSSTSYDGLTARGYYMLKHWTYTNKAHLANRVRAIATF